MGRGSSKVGGGGGKLQKFTVNPDAAYQPDDGTNPEDIVKNPIPFVGDGKDWEIGEEIEENAIQTKYYDSFEIDINKVQSLQSFVLRSGLENYQRWDDQDKPYVVEYEGKYYLLDGNHRMAKAKLDGKKTINVNLSVREKR